LIKNVNSSLELNAMYNKTMPQNLSESAHYIIADLLHELETALQYQKANDIDSIMEQLKLQPLDIEMITVLEEISDNVLIAEFDEAIKGINKLINLNINKKED